MKQFRVYRGVPFFTALVFVCSLIYQQSTYASPFGQGLFNADVPFGGNTTLSIALGGNVSLGLTSSGGNLSGSGSHTVTVTSTDVIGYKLYAFAPSSTAMTSGAETIPASANSSLATLSINTWGYNTTGSTSNFMGMRTTPSLIKDATGPFKSGDSTTITYGALTDVTKAAGSYSVGVVYTAVAENE